MAVQLSYACFSFLPMNRSRIYRPRAVASEDYGTLTSQEEKVKLGGSELKVTRLGIGAWSWGDNSYWNNFEWDGKFLKLLSNYTQKFEYVETLLRLIVNFLAE